MIDHLTSTCSSIIKVEQGTIVRKHSENHLLLSEGEILICPTSRCSGTCPEFS
jgi:hypothetical protein